MDSRALSEACAPCLYLVRREVNAHFILLSALFFPLSPPLSLSPGRYSIDRHTDLERQFNIHVDDGKITLAKPLDRETDTWHNITVTATEVRK